MIDKKKILAEWKVELLECKTEPEVQLIDDVEQWIEEAKYIISLIEDDLSKKETYLCDECGTEHGKTSLLYMQCPKCLGLTTHTILKRNGEKIR